MVIVSVMSVIYFMGTASSDILIAAMFVLLINKYQNDDNRVVCQGIS